MNLWEVGRDGEKKGRRDDKDVGGVVNVRRVTDAAEVGGGILLRRKKVVINRNTGFEAINVLFQCRGAGACCIKKTKAPIPSHDVDYKPCTPPEKQV